MRHVLDSRFCDKTAAGSSPVLGLCGSGLEPSPGGRTALTSSAGRGASGSSAFGLRTSSGRFGER